MHLPFDVGLTNKRLVVDSPASKERTAPKERPSARAAEPSSRVEQSASELPAAHSVVLMLVLSGYVLLCVSDALDAQPRHGFKCHVAIVGSMPPYLLYLHTRDARLRIFFAGILLHVLALVAVLSDGRHQEPHVAVDVLMFIAAVMVHFLYVKGVLTPLACMAWCIVSAYVSSLFLLVLFRHMLIMPQWSLLALEQTFLLMSLILGLLASRSGGAPSAGALTLLAARGMP